ncbi:MAG: hypothetical protein M0C28_14175 [Candidatus Moduliflexus flocculans]|nr:hypothetical protein [Candidatus Moduliflexus flocculans]
MLTERGRATSRCCGVSAAPPLTRDGPCGASPSAMPGRLGELSSSAEVLEGIRRQACSRCPSRLRRGRLARGRLRRRLRRVPARGACATFPVVIPFMLVSEVALAMRVSNAVALVTLFACGYALGRHCRWYPLAARPGDGRDRGGAGGRHHRARRLSMRLRAVKSLAAAAAGAGAGLRRSRQRGPTVAAFDRAGARLGLFRDRHVLLAALTRTTSCWSLPRPIAGRCISRRATTTRRSTPARCSPAGRSRAATS